MKEDREDRDREVVICVGATWSVPNADISRIFTCVWGRDISLRLLPCAAKKPVLVCCTYRVLAIGFCYLSVTPEASGPEKKRHDNKGGMVRRVLHVRT